MSSNPFNRRAGEDQSENAPQFQRASGDCICPVCEMTYRKHPLSYHRDFQGAPYLHVLCDDRLVKL